MHLNTWLYMHLAVCTPAACGRAYIATPVCSGRGYSYVCTPPPQSTLSGPCMRFCMRMHHYRREYAVSGNNNNSNSNSNSNPIALETLGPINESAVQFLYDLDRRMG